MTIIPRKEFHQAAIKVRTLVKSGKGVDLNCGICSNLYDVTWHDGVYTLVKKYQKSWPKYSGVENYPVIDPEEWGEAVDQYDTSNNKWIGSYGRLRMELLDHLIRVSR